MTITTRDLMHVFDLTQAERERYASYSVQEFLDLYVQGHTEHLRKARDPEALGDEYWFLSQWIDLLEEATERWDDNPPAVERAGTELYTCLQALKELEFRRQEHWQAVMSKS